MTNYLSNKIRFVSFVLIVIVILLHAQLISLSTNISSFVIQRFISGNIARAAVPFFYLISGYLFTNGLKGTQLKSVFKRKLKSRVATLVIPYLIWSAVGIIVFICESSFFRETGSESITLPYLINETFIHPHVFYQLWFIRDLIVCVILSPLIYFAVKYLREMFIAILLVIWFNMWEIGFITTTSILFFSTGMYMEIYRDSWVEYRFRSVWFWIIPVIWISSCFIFAYNDYASYASLFSDITLGIISIWIAYDLLYESSLSRFVGMEILSLGFFLFLVHEPLLTIIKKVLIATIGTGNDWNELFIYFISPLIVIAILIPIGLYTKKHFSKTYKFLTGGR